MTWSKLSASEKDALAAKKVMGWKRSPNGLNWMKGRLCICSEFSPSSNIKDAVEVLNTFPEWRIDKLGRHYQVFIDRIPSFSNILPDAICMAALFAKGVEIED